MCTELVETSRLWARYCAQIDPAWAESLAKNLTRVTYSDAHWSASKGAAIAQSKVLLYGLPDEHNLPPFPAKRIIMKQLTVLGVTNNEMAWEPLLGLVARGTVNVRDMVTHRFTLDELPQAIALVSKRPPDLIKAVVHPWD